MKKPSLLVVFLTVFIDLVGFGIVLPLLPIYSRDFGASGWLIGVIIASFSAMQFLFAPAWGRLSDRIGRRPVLLVSTAGAALSYALFGIASGLGSSQALWLLLVSRVFAGICGANITVAQAYIADITPPEQRSAKMGLIGMAFGLGFIFGPALGAVSYRFLGLTGPGWIAAGLCAFNFGLTYLVLPESWKPTSEPVAGRPRLTHWTHTLARPQIGLLIGIFFLATFCFATFETTLGLLIGRNFHLDFQHDDRAKTAVGYLFAYCGVIGAIIQGGAIGRLVKKMGESRLIVLSLVLTGVSLVLVPFNQTHEPFRLGLLGHKEGWPWLGLLGVLALLSVGSSLTRPPLFGLLSLLTPKQEQGATIGVAQSAGSLARIVAPIFAATLFDYHPAWPYVVCGAVSLLTALWAWQSLGRNEAAVEAGGAVVPHP
jgi:MFS family permease